MGLFETGGKLERWVQSGEMGLVEMGGKLERWVAKLRDGLS